MKGKWQWENSGKRLDKRRTITKTTKRRRLGWGQPFSNIKGGEERRGYRWVKNGKRKTGKKA